MFERTWIVLPWLTRASALEGLAICPETAVCLDVLAGLAADGTLARDERVVVFNTGNRMQSFRRKPTKPQLVVRWRRPIAFEFAKTIWSLALGISLLWRVTFVSDCMATITKWRPKFLDWDSGFLYLV